MCGRWRPTARVSIRSLAFVSERSGKGERRIYIAEANGSTARALALPAHARRQTNPSWGIRPAGDSCTIEGTIYVDTLIGTAGHDVLCGGAGNDVINPRGGSDTILAGTGADVIFARDGKRDIVNGGPGHDLAHLDPRDRKTSVELAYYNG